MAKVLYAETHSDDFVLSMGPCARKHLAAGHEVHVLLLTSGVDSGVRAQMGLEEDVFQELRDDEFLRAARALGLRRQNIHFAPSRPREADFSPAYARASIRSWFQQHGTPGDTHIKCYSHLPLEGRHQNHVDTGVAALELYLEGMFTSYRAYVEPWNRAAFAAAYPGNRLAIASLPAGSIDDQRLYEAIQAFTVIDSISGREGIGGRSVMRHFQDLAVHRSSFYHVGA